MLNARALSVLLVLAIMAGAIWWIMPGKVSPPAMIATAEPAGATAEPEPEGVSTTVAQAEPASSLDISPREIQLSGPGDGAQIVVQRRRQDGAVEDLTRQCRFEVSPDVATISATGYVRAIAPGNCTVSVYHEGEQAAAGLTVRNVVPISDFALDVVPILTKAGCNSGQCHGAAQGKGGLHLSLFGYDPDGDYTTLTRGLESRRLDPLDPDASLLLLKPTLATEHGGGLRLRPHAPETEIVRRWISAGAPHRDETRGQLERIEIEPTSQFLATAPIDQQLRVIARYSDQTTRDVTRLCLFVSNDPATLAVDKNGLVRMLRRGQADIVVRFASKVATIRLAAPFQDSTSFDYASVPRRNFIDELIVDQLEQMRLPVSPRTGDAEFLRRIWFDLVGHMPDPKVRGEARVVEAFLADTDPNKRDKMIEQLLDHPDFVTFWSLKFGDHLQISSTVMGGAAGKYRIWLTEQLGRNVAGSTVEPAGYDQMVRNLLLATGSMRPGRVQGPEVYYAAPREPGEIAEQVARRFLGVRIRCARCHDHPLDVWTQDDYFGFASFFGRLRVESEDSPFAQEVKLVEENAVRHLRTGEPAPPKFLGGDTPEVPADVDPREALVDWMFDSSNPRFVRASANWVWAHLMGRGLVEPVDDLRDTNPAVNPELLDALGNHFREIGYDLRGLVRTICQSEAYQRSSLPVPGNEADEKLFSRALLKPLTAPQLADAIAQVTGVPNGYGMNRAKDTRAIEINDTIDDYLLDVLGRCDRTAGCEVGALSRPASLKMALHLIIGDAINNKFARRGSVVAQMASAARDMDPESVAEMRRVQIESLYLRAYCRRPSETETEFWQEALAEAPDYASGLEDMMWALINSREFTFNH